MSIIVKKRGDKKYLYFAVGGSKRLYLGTIDNPKEENIYGAIGHIRSRIREYEQRISELENYLPVRKEELSCSIQYNLVFFDLDGVLYEKPWYEISSDEVAVSTWDVIFQELGIYNVHEKLKHNYETGVFKSYMEWTEAACEVLKSVGLDKKTFETVINRRPLMQGAAELCEELGKNGVKIAIATGSFKALAQRAKNELKGITHILAHCELNFDEKGLLSSWNLETIDYKDKARFVEKTAKKEGIPLKRCVYIGDDVNDIYAFKKVGLPIAFNCRKPKVLQAVKVVIESRDLKGILPYLCIPTEKKST